MRLGYLRVTYGPTLWSPRSPLQTCPVRLIMVLCLPSRNRFISCRLWPCLQKDGSTMEVGYLEAFSKIWDQSWIEWNERGPTKTFLTDFIHEVSSDSFISTKDILICLVLGVAFTILRCLLSAAFFKVRIFRNFEHKLCKFFFLRKLVSLKGFRC